MSRGNRGAWEVGRDDPFKPRRGPNASGGFLMPDEVEPPKPLTKPPAGATEKVVDLVDA